MESFFQGYYNRLEQLIRLFSVTDREGNPFEGFTGFEAAQRLIVECSRANSKLMFIGNGASAAIASHMATDYWKAGGIRSIAFNDSSLLTCIGNDYGYPHVFEKPVDMFADPGDILVAISSSGKSENILKGVEAARFRKAQVITLSGFDPSNPLRSQGDINFHVPEPAYGPVEVLHLSICHGILDALIDEKKQSL